MYWFELPILLGAGLGVSVFQGSSYLMSILVGLPEKAGSSHAGLSSESREEGTPHDYRSLYPFFPSM